MKVEIRETKITTAEFEPAAFLHEFPMEWQDYLGGDRIYDEEDVIDFIKESFHECGTDIFLDLKVETEQENEVEINVHG